MTVLLKNPGIYEELTLEGIILRAIARSDMSEEEKLAEMEKVRQALKSWKSRLEGRSIPNWLRRDLDL